MSVTKLNMVKARNLALLQEMERDPAVLILGEDVGVDGGVFRVTDDLQRKFGSQRVIDSPLAEAAIIGTAVGMALYGLKPVCEIQFSGFAFQCFHQIENHAAKEEVPADPEALPIGRAQVVREGRDLTLIAYGAMLRVAREAADVLQAEDRVETEVVDLLTIAPLDRETIVTSVAKTGRAVV